MASARVALDRTRRAAALVALVMAATLVVRSLAAKRDDPVRGAELQAVLDEFAGVLAPVESLVPSGEPLRYLEPLDAKGRPVFRNDLLPFVQAVLAPLRIGRGVEARYLLVHHRSPQGLQLVPGLERARSLSDLGGGFALFERGAP